MFPLFHFPVGLVCFSWSTVPEFARPGFPRPHSCLDCCIGLASSRRGFFSYWVLFHCHHPFSASISISEAIPVVLYSATSSAARSFPDDVSKFGDCLASGVGR